MSSLNSAPGRGVKRGRNAFRMKSEEDYKPIRVKIEDVKEEEEFKVNVEDFSVKIEKDTFEVKQEDVTVRPHVGVKEEEASSQVDEKFVMLKKEMQSDDPTILNTDQDPIQSTSDSIISTINQRPGTSADTLSSTSSVSELSVVFVPPVLLPKSDGTSICPGDQSGDRKRPFKHVGGKTAKKSSFQMMAEFNDTETEKDVQGQMECSRLDREYDVERRRLDLEAALVISDMCIQQQADSMRAFTELRGMIAELSEQVGLLRRASVPQTAHSSTPQSKAQPPHRP